MTSIHAYKVEGISGGEIDFSTFRGKKIMVVNTASECGYTPQYAQLQELSDTFQDQLVIIGFPCNDFGGQEPGSSKEIQAFCTKNYGVTFPLAAKISVKPGTKAPVYEWLTQKKLNGVSDSEVKWNFQKYLLNELGQLVRVVPHNVSPIDESILDWLSK